MRKVWRVKTFEQLDKEYGANRSFNGSVTIRGFSTFFPTDKAKLLGTKVELVSSSLESNKWYHPIEEWTFYREWLIDPDVIEDFVDELFEGIL